jgi:hypothetical protein
LSTSVDRPSTSGRIRDTIGGSRLADMLFRRIAPVIGLLFLAPWVGEYLLGNVSGRHILAIPFLVPLYGGGALLIREVTRRTGRGWPTILLLGLAYGFVEAGLVDQAMFNPSFEGWKFQQATPVPALGISAVNTMSFVVGHAVWSIAIPIAIVEMLTPRRRSTPWLGNIGLTVTVVTYLSGCWIIFADIRDSEGFLATPAQRLGVVAVALVLIATAFVIRRRAGAPHADRPVPGPWPLGLTAFALSGVFFARPDTWAGFVLGALLIGVATVLVLRWAGRSGWSVRSRFAVAGGALLTYAWGGFVLTSLTEPHDPVRWGGNVIFALAAVGLLMITARQVRA